MGTPQNPNRKETLALINQVFAVPYQRNPTFTGRINLLKTLKTSLFNHESKQHHPHRIALSGPGGIGKTQCALEYAHQTKHLYESIYWIPAQNQASIIAGYQRIASAEGLQFNLNAKPKQIARGMISWLGKQKSWLLVFDGLDATEVASNIFPENGVMRHTIITTRNRRI